MIESPNISATGENAIEQIKSYLFRLSEQLNYSMQSVENNIQEQKVILKAATAEQSEEKKARTAVETFYTLKDLIIKSADIVEAYGDILEQRYNSHYAAQSDFGTYTQDAIHRIETSAYLVSHEFVRVENEEVGNKATTLTASGRIKIGYLDTDTQSRPVYGVEVGQTDTEGGVKTFKKFARFTAEKLSFYNSAGDELAYFSGKDMHISRAIIDNKIKLGGYEIKTDSGAIAFKWVG